jgi:hypothetical protein
MGMVLNLEADNVGVALPAGLGIKEAIRSNARARFSPAVGDKVMGACSTRWSSP